MSRRRSLLSLRHISKEVIEDTEVFHNHLYETVILFLTGVGIGIYLFELREFYKSTHPPSIPRSAQGSKVKNDLALRLLEYLKGRR